MLSKKSMADYGETTVCPLACQSLCVSLATDCIYVTLLEFRALLLCGNEVGLKFLFQDADLEDVGLVLRGCWALHLSPPDKDTTGGLTYREMKKPASCFRKRAFHRVWSPDTHTCSTSTPSHPEKGSTGLPVADSSMWPVKNALTRWFVIMVITLLCPLPGICQDQPARALQSLLQSPKIRAPQSVLQDLVAGKPTTRVIVNLHKPAGTRSILKLKDMGVRNQLQQAVTGVQDRVIHAMDPGKVRITNTFSYVFGFSAEVTAEGLQDLIDSGDVASIEQDRILEAHLAHGIPLMNASAARSSYNGTGLAIAICDTGIDYTHSKLGGSGFPNSKVVGGWDCGDNDADPMDQHGHGTCCAGIAAGDLGTSGDYIGGVAYNARLYALKISYGSGGSAYSADMIEAWEWCVTHKNDDPDNPIMIISTSFGGGQYFSACDGESAAMTAAAANAVSAGITIFVSSGNDGYCDAMSWPACISHVISVGAVYDANIGTYYPCVSASSCASKTATGQCTKWYATDVTAADMVTSYSNTASFLSLLAPSNQAYTTDIVDNTGYSADDYATGFGGTSAACPYAAGAAACLQNAAKAITSTFLTPGQVKSKFIDTGDSITDEKVDITKPRVNLGAAVATVPSNVGPTANAGTDQTVDEGDTVTLDGSNSSDPDYGISSYLWEQTAGTSVTLSNETAVQPSFTAPDVGINGESMTFKLTVTDTGNLESIDTCIVNVTWVNAPPVANAGPNQTADEGDTVTLDGSNSSDPDDGISSYSWEQTSGTAITLSSSTAIKPTFTTPEVDPDGESMIFRLTVTDNGSLQSTDTCIVNDTWANTPPVANAGADQTVDEGDTVTLDGSNSTDSDGAVSFYLWSQTGGASVTLSDSTAANPTFVTPPVGGSGTEVTFQLTVTDSGGLKASDETCVTIVDNGIVGFPDDVITITVSTGEQVGIKENGGGNCVSLSAVAPSTIPDTVDKPGDLVYGLIDITIKVDTPGATATVTIYLPTAASDEHKWYKYSSVNGWTDYSDNAVFNSARDQITLTLIDGGTGDDDGIANGVIVDPSGLGLTPAASSSGGDSSSDGGGSDGSGCFISAVVSGQQSISFERQGVLQ